MKAFLSIKEASEYLSLEYKTVYRLVRAGEIPAARLGGVYRIKQQDLESYIQQQTQRVATRSDENGGALFSTPARCGRCMRVFQDSSQLIAACTIDACDQRLCETCWNVDEARHCARHEPTHEEYVRRAFEEFAQGLGPRPVTLEQAHQLELNYLARFDRKIREQTLRLPGDSKVVRVTDWDKAHLTNDHLARIKNLVLELDFVKRDPAGLPLNRSSIYLIAPAAGKQYGLTISATCFAHLETLIRRGVDTKPATLSELLDLLQKCIRHADETLAYHICAYASPTGWSPDALAYIDGTERGKTFTHLLVMPLLVDLTEGKVHHNRLDDRLTEFAELFSPQLRKEQIESARAYIEKTLLQEQHSLTIQDIAQALSLRVDVIDEAFKHFKHDDRFVIVDMPGIGPVVSPRV